MSTTTIDAERQDALVGRLFSTATHAWEILTIYLGERLGLYRALGDRGPLTGAALADATGTHERYVREWLEQQAVTGLLEVDDPALPAAERRYSLPAEHVEPLLDRDSLAYFAAPVARATVAIAQAMPELLRAFRTGGGVPYERYGNDFVEGQRDFSAPHYRNLLPSWIAAAPDVHERLQAPSARAAEIGCGAGIAAIELAKAYGRLRVDGFDVDEASIALARAAARAEGVEERVRFHLRDIADSAVAGRYDVVMTFDSLHHFPQPVEALRAMRRLAADTGRVIVADSSAPDGFSAPSPEGDFERFRYGVSVLFCLPTAMAEQPSAGAGAVVRPSTLRAWAREAGFSRVAVLPIEHAALRFYQLTP